MENQQAQFVPINEVEPQICLPELNNKNSLFAQLNEHIIKMSEWIEYRTRSIQNVHAAVTQIKKTYTFGLRPTIWEMPR